MKRRVVTACLLGLLCAVGISQPASAHTGSAVKPTNYETAITVIEPAIPGLVVKVIDAGDRLLLRNNGTSEIAVEGYEGEPYLRIGSDGVFANTASPAYYLNQDRQGLTEVPETAGASEPPRWTKLSDGRETAWHDQRIHWMSSTDEPSVQQDPDERHVIYPAWNVPLAVGDTPVAITGTLMWVPPTTPTPWFAIAALLAVVGATSLLARTRTISLLALLTVLAVGGGLIVSIGVALSANGTVSSRISAAFEAVLPIGVATVIAVVSLRRAQQRAEDSAWFFLFSGFVALLLVGVTDFGFLTHSQLPSAGPAWLIRAGVALALGAGAGVSIASAVLVWRLRQKRVHQAPEPSAA